MEATPFVAGTNLSGLLCLIIDLNKLTLSISLECRTIWSIKKFDYVRTVISNCVYVIYFVIAWIIHVFLRLLTPHETPATIHIVSRLITIHVAHLFSMDGNHIRCYTSAVPFGNILDFISSQLEFFGHDSELSKKHNAKLWGGWSAS
ncbi:hypothetical protein HALTITAN_1290 [Vreelandella titanicae BH1]|uniref:Uncharacterized protein n=1 Tax=Vreelandella titanicae BH1 TaxID=1204738 RepID=L9UAD4_9GAMM|nr:hypothetical protein HALTITAN_1290 [Halomonas titanicae BH1]